MDRTAFTVSLSLSVSLLLLSAPTLAQTDPPAPVPPTTVTTPPPATPTPTPEATKTPAPKKTPEPAKPPKAPTKIELTDGVRQVWRTPADLGIQANAKGEVTVDQALLKKSLERIAPKFHQEPVNAKPYMYQKKFYISAGSDGRALDVAETAGKIVARLQEKPTEAVFQVAEKKSAPILTADRLKGITGVLSTFETITSADSKRNNNVDIGRAKIDGTLLSPGETFSLNQTVGERTVENGFKEAHVFVDAKIVQGIGGGVSQVTGTLFNAAALAGLSIKEVNPHSRPVAYLALGRDATVAYGDKDLKFTNNTSAPVYIQYTFPDKRHLRATIFGAVVPGRMVSLRPTVQEIGPGKINAQLYRVFKQDGKIVGRERLVSHAYRWEP